MSTTQLLRNALLVVGNTGVVMAQEYLRANGGSETLAKFMDFVVDEVRPSYARGRILVPHYWANFVHDGRGAIQMPPGRYMCYFPDKTEDPRTSGGLDYPVRRQDRRHLSKDEFNYYVAINRERVAQGQTPIMVVTKAVGPVKNPAPSIPFFTVGLKRLPEVASRVIPPEFRLFLEGRGLLKQEKKSAVGRIG